MTELPGRPGRRNFLKGTAAGAIVAGLPISAVAQQPEPPIPLEDYRPEFFTAGEWSFILAAVARLIPSEGEGPGAIETRVPVFIDRQLVGEYGTAAKWYMDGPHDAAADPTRGWQSPLTPAEIYRAAIPVFDAWCEKTHGSAFAALPATRQDEALTALQKGGIGLAADCRDFFQILLQNTKEGYFADPMYGGNHGMQAWVHIGFPGARAAFTEWVGRHNVKYPLGPVSISGERA